MPTTVATGPDAYVGPDLGIDVNLYGYRYSGFRSFERFDEQTAGDPAGMVGWPGGYLAEDRDDLFGLHYAETGLANPESGFPSVTEVMRYAVENDHGLAITLPTVRWHEDVEGMRGQVRIFVQKLLGGDFGPLPNNLIIEVGSEYYGLAAEYGHTSEEMAPLYGRMASVMIEEIRAVEEDPTLNRLGAEIEIAVQAGRNEACSCRIVEAMPDTALSEIDYVVLSRMPVNFAGIDRAMGDYDAALNTWYDAVTDAGGEKPQLFMTSFNVASPTRSEALRAYVETMAGQGTVVDPATVDLAGRSDAGFEQFWQDRIERFDLGFDQPKVLMELMAEYHELGATAGTAFGVDQLHPGRLSFQDEDGNSVSMIGMDFLNFLYESVDDTRMLDVSLTNSARTETPVYAFEGQDHTTIFVMGGRTPGEVELDIEGLDRDFTRAYVDTLTPVVPDDWMQRYGIPDNPNVDETPEGETFADTIKGTQTPDFRGDNMVVSVEAPGQVVRIVLTHSAAGEAEVEDWVVAPEASIDLVEVFADDGDGGGGGGPDDPDPPDGEDPDDDVTDGGGDGGGGMIFLLLLPLLALAGMG